MFLEPALGEVRDFELPLDLYVILRDELSERLPKRPACGERRIMETPVTIGVIIYRIWESFAGAKSLFGKGEG